MKINNVEDYYKLRGRLVFYRGSFYIITYLDYKNEFIRGARLPIKNRIPKLPTITEVSKLALDYGSKFWTIIFTEDKKIITKGRKILTDNRDYITVLPRHLSLNRQIKTKD